ncbi:MAG TPA: MBL fold metallo-hydrolase [Vicinamibacterales bacterium]|nr:MBL fold metallo-hydrolase [Vicinamibacterales bacterium]
MTGSGNNTWLLDGVEPTLVDAGVGHAPHVDAIAAALGGRDLARVLVTHHHADHSSGIDALRTRWPSLDAAKCVQAGERGWRGLADNERVRAGDRDLTVIHTPGHAPDHVCFWDPADRALYSGDMLAIGTTVMIPAGRGGNLRQYLASLERMAALDPRIAYPGHGPVIDRPVDLIRAYIAHRAMREQQVLACWRDGMRDLDAIVTKIYGELVDPVRRAARETIAAHLEKLREDGSIQ